MITYPSGTVLVKKVDGSNNFIEDALTSNDIELDVTSGYVLYSNGDTITGSSLVTWDAENSAFKLGSNLKYTSSTFLVHSNTVDGSDNQYMGIAGGGSLDNTRGAYVRLGGNESSLVGDAIISAGDVGGANLILSAPNNKVLIQTGGATKWSVDNTGLLLSHLSDGRIVANTTDGSDNQLISLGGGGDYHASRGAVVTVRGNEYSSEGGTLGLTAGDTSGAYIKLDARHTSGKISFLTGSTERYTITSSGHLVPFANSTYDIGSTSNRIRDCYIGTSANISNDRWIKFRNAAGSADVNVLKLNTTDKSLLNSTSEVHLQVNNSSILAVTSSQLQLATPTAVLSESLTIRSNTTDGSDDRSIVIAAGGGTSNTRGGSVGIYGNEHANSGQIHLVAGDSGTINLVTGGNTRWKVDSSGNLESQNSSGLIKANTSDSSDNAELHVVGGGAAGYSRGGGLACYGNEHVSTPGRALVYCGNVTNSYIQLQTYGSQPIYFATNDIIRWSIDSAGNLVPATNDAYNIGTSSYRASTIYLVNSPDVSSDMRLKTDVTSIDSGLALQKVCNLNPIEYKFIPSFESSGLLKSGFKAQEIVNEIPTAVTQGDSDLTKQLGDEGFEMWSLKSEQIIPYLVAAIQKLKEEQDLLNQKLNN